MPDMPGGAMARRLLARGIAASLTAVSTAALAEHAAAGEILVLGQHAADPIANAPNSVASLDAADIRATVNAINVEDTLKYLPSLVVRKRHIGDTQSPLATRTSGVGASARSLIYADGALLSALIGNNNTIASPRWGLVSPQEIARVEVLYGPFSAAYPGNSIGAVVNITTRLPDHLEATVDVATSIQQFDQYGTSRTLPAREIGGTVGDRFGPFAVFASAAHVASNSQPLAYVTATRPAVPGAAGTIASGAYADVNRTGAPIAVLGAAGFEYQTQDMLKLKLALDAAPWLHLAYVGGLFLNDTDASAQTYLTGAGGVPVYAGALNAGGYPYSIAASAFSNNVYAQDQRHWSHSLSAGGTNGRLSWQAIGTLYDFAGDVQRLPTGALPGALAGGAGAIVRLDGTGWRTFDAKAKWSTPAQAISLGYHIDRFTLASNRYATSDWRRGGEGAITVASRGKTRTQALWVQDAVHLAAPLTLTVGVRQEWWRAYDGYNLSAAPVLAVSQPRLSADRTSPKASLEWKVAGPWTATLSYGQAWRFPTVSELYQAVTTGPTITVPNPDLKPERARSAELAIERTDAAGHIRLSLFTESIRDALLSQSAPLVPGSTALYTYVQNVERVRTRGIELAFERRDLLVEGLGVSGSLTLVDPEIRGDAAFPAAVGKRPPQVPRRRATLVATWRPVPRLTLSAAGRYSSRSFATIDNSDTIGNTYQGFGSYLVADLRATLDVTPHWSLALGVDNVNNDKYFLFHPFPQRTFHASASWRL